MAPGKMINRAPGGKPLDLDVDEGGVAGGAFIDLVGRPNEWSYAGRL